MLVRDYIEEVLWSFRKQRLRTALTATGIGVGSFAIAIMVALGSGLQGFIEMQIRAFGNPRVVYVFPKFDWEEQVLDRLASIGKPAGPVKEQEKKQKDVQRGGLLILPRQVKALRALKGVKSVSPASWAECDGIRLLDGPPEEYQIDFVGLGDHPLVGEPMAGRLPRAEASDEIVIAPQYAQSWKIAPADLVGREVEIRVPKVDYASRFVARDPGEYKRDHRIFRARIVGLAERSLVSRSAYVPMAFGRAIMGYQSGKENLFTDERFGYQGVVHIAKDADPDVVKGRIKELQTFDVVFRKRKNTGAGPFYLPEARWERLPLDVRSVDEQLSEVKRAFLAIDAFLMSFGLLAILVATLGIANTLLMSISERTREIGVMKALGATESTIRRMFAVEAAAIGLVGGLGGVFVAFVLGQVANALLPRTRWFPDVSGLGDVNVFIFPWWLVLGAVLFSTLVGALAGLYPASRAARLDPVEALRYE